MAGYAIALAIVAHGWLGWTGQRYAFAVLDESSLVRLDTRTGDVAVCGVRGAFLSAERSVVCADGAPADD